MLFFKFCIAKGMLKFQVHYAFKYTFGQSQMASIKLAEVFMLATPHIGFSLREN